MFVESALKLFLWSPSKSIYSLVQKCGALLCSLDSSVADLAEVNCDVKAESEFKYLVIEIIDACCADSEISDECGDANSSRTFSGSSSNLKFNFKLDGSSSNAQLAAALSHYKHTTFTEHDILYLRTSIRVHEKKRLINHLAHPSQKLFVTHIAKCMPLLLNELSSVRRS